MPPQTPPTHGRVLRSTAPKKTARDTDERSATDEDLHPHGHAPHPKHLSMGSSQNASITDLKSTTITPPTAPNRRLIVGLRSTILLVALGCYVWCDVMQGMVDVTWCYLRGTWWFGSVYFESVWATVTYGYIIALYPYALHYMPWLDGYKVDTATTYVHQSVGKILLEAVVYVTPLGLLDTFMVKRYNGVDPAEWTARAQHVIQTTRALPLDSPTFGQLCFQVIGGVIIYDALFFFLHLALHRSRPLYVLFHATHHDHSAMHAHVTNQLSVGERVALILAANQALKILYSHPLSRAAFVPVFIWLLVDNHSGYDLPWGLQHLVPARLVGGPRVHYAHHVLGTRHYQPFLTYLDSALQWWEGRGCHGKRF